MSAYATYPDDPSYDLKKHLLYVQELHRAYAFNTEDKCDELALPHEHPALIWELLEREGIFAPKTPTMENRERLKYLQSAFTGGFAPIAAQRISEIADALPAPSEDGITVPLSALIDVRDVIAKVYGLARTEVGGVRVFPRLYEQLRVNIIKASGYEPQTYTDKPIISAEDSKLEGEELVAAYLDNTTWDAHLHMPVPFAIPRKTWASHGIILAPPNHGKTQLLGSLISGFLDGSDPVGCFVLDPHGDLYSTLRDRVPGHRLVLLDPDSNPPPLNFLDFGTSTEAQTLQTFSYLMSSLSGGLSDKQGAIVPYLLKLLRTVPEASLETLRLVVDEKVKKPEASAFAANIASLEAVDRGFFHNQFYSSRMQETKDAIGWKLYSALSSDAFRQMFSAPTNSINFDQAIAERKVVLVKGARSSLGDEGMRVFLQFIVAQYFAAGLRRDRLPPEQRHLCMMLVDEAHTVFDSPIIANILTELRKYACGFVGATQVLHQIAENVKHAVYGATAIKVSGPVSHNDATQLAREMYTTTDFIRSMRARERKSADWAFHVSGMTEKAIRVTVPYGSLEAMPKLATTNLAGISSKLVAPQTKEPLRESGPSSTKASPENDSLAPDDDKPERWH